MGHFQKTSLKKEPSLCKKKSFQYGIIISLLLGLFICLVEVRGQCECTTRTAVINDGRKFCYVKGEYGADDCCEAKTSRFVNLCVNYDLCDEDEGEDIEKDKKTEEIVDPRFVA